jgi:hypothetical protein
MVRSHPEDAARAFCSAPDGDPEYPLSVETLGSHHSAQRMLLRALAHIYARDLQDARTCR